MTLDRRRLVEHFERKARAEWDLHVELKQRGGTDAPLHKGRAEAFEEAANYIREGAGQ
jgi:hypothetical protein